MPLVVVVAAAREKVRLPTHLVLRRASVSRISGSWQQEDYDLLDGEREIGRIYRLASGGVPAKPREFGSTRIWPSR
jgi:hypothetical protein